MRIIGMLAAMAMMAAASGAAAEQSDFTSLLANGFEIKAVTYMSPEEADAYFNSEKTPPSKRALVFVTLQAHAASAICTFYATGWFNQTPASMTNKEICTVHR